jgi:hypothetical protein
MEKKVICIAVNKKESGEIKEFKDFDDFTKQIVRTNIVKYDDDGYPCEHSYIITGLYDLSIWDPVMLYRWEKDIFGRVYLAELQRLPELGHLADLWEKIESKEYDK